RDGGGEPWLCRCWPFLWRALEPLRQSDPPQRQRRAETALPAETNFRRTCRCACDERIRCRVGRRVDEVARGEARRSLRLERREDVDPQRSGGRYACCLRQDRSGGGPARHHGVYHREVVQGISYGPEARQARDAWLRHERARFREL